MPSLDFGFIAAKLHGLRAKMFDREKLAETINVRSLGELAVQMGRDLTLEDHYELQRSIIAEHVQVLTALTRFLSEPHAGFLRTLLARYPIENLKVLIRCVLRPQYRGRLSKLLIPLPERIDIDFEELIKAEDVATLINAVPVDMWRDALLKALPIYQQTEESFVLESALDRVYWSAVQDAWELLRSPEAQAAEPLVTLEQDTTRLLIALRSARNYGLMWSQIRGLLPPSTGLITDRLIENTLKQEAGGALELRSLLVNTLRIIYDDAEFVDLPALERAIWGRTYQLANRTFYDHYENFAILVAFYYLKRMELRNLICTIEMVRYGATPSEIGERLVPPLKTGVR